MVGVQEANPFRESASALLGGGQPLSSGVERNDISQFARRINFPAKSTIFNESEPSVAIYQLSSGRVTLQETVPAARIFPPDLRLYALRQPRGGCDFWLAGAWWLDRAPAHDLRPTPLKLA